MSSKYESALVQAISLLEERGYSVQLEAESSSRKGFRADLLGWGNDNSGKTKPIVAIEMISAAGTEVHIELSIAKARRQLRAIRDKFGTELHFIFDGTTWRSLSENFLEIEPSNGPPKISRGAGIVSDVDSISSLISNSLWRTFDRLRNEMSPESSVFIAIEELLEGAKFEPGKTVFLVSNPKIGLDPMALVAACTKQIEKVLGRNANFVTPAKAVDFLFNLIGGNGFYGDFFDPFSGSGSTLREFAIRTENQGEPDAKIEGYEINNRVSDLSRLLNSLVDSRIHVMTENSYFANEVLCDFSVSIPPFGVRMHESMETPFGSVMNGDIAAIYKIAASLKSGGIAACITVPGWTWSRSRESVEFRNWLSSNFHVVALLSLPAIMNHTAIKPIVLIIRNTAPGETIVGTLGDDWLVQSTPNSELSQAIGSALKR